MGAYLELMQSASAVGAIMMILIGSRWLKKSLKEMCSPCCCIRQSFE